MLGTLFLYYSILILSTAFVCAREKACGEKNKELAFVFLSSAFIIAFIPAAIRYRVGTDFWAYVEIFEDIAKNNETHVEIGYEYLNRVVAYAGLGAQSLIILSAFITYLLFYKALPKKSGWYINVIFITSYYLYTYSNIRTGIVFGLMFYALMDYVKHKKIIKFLCFMGLAFLFHKSSILYAIVPILLSDRVVNFFSLRRNVVFATIFCIVFFIFSSQIVKFIVDIGIVAAFGYSDYVDSELYFSDPQLGTGLGVLARALPLILYIFFGFSEVGKNRGIERGYAPAFFFIFLISLSSAIEILSRLENLFFPIYIFVCHTLVTISLKIKKTVFMTMTIPIFTILFIKDIQGSTSDQCKGIRISPYVSIFNKEDDKSLTIDRNVCGI